MNSFPAVRRSFVLLVALCLALPLAAADEGKEMIRGILQDKNLVRAVILNANNRDMRGLIRKELIAKSPDSEKSVDGFLDDMDIAIEAEELIDGHQATLTVSSGKVSPRSRSLLLSQGLPKAFIKPTGTLLSIKIDGKELTGQPLDDIGAAFAHADRSQYKKAGLLNPEQEKIVNSVFDKNLIGAVVFGRKSPDWRKSLEKLTKEHPGLQARLDAVDNSISHVVALMVENAGVKVAVIIALGDFNEKARDSFVAGGIPESLVSSQAAMLAVNVNGAVLKGDKLQDFADAFKKAPVAAQPSLIELSK